MTNYREILRLHSLGFNKTEIATSCPRARNTVAVTLPRAANCGLQWPLPDEISDKQLSERLFRASASKPVYKMPDYVHKELQRSGVTLNLLWLEYCDHCRSAGEILYQSTQFNKYYGEYLAKTNATMHLNHKPGEVMQVDWVGDTAAVIDTETGEVIQAYVFVATLSYSGYSYLAGALGMVAARRLFAVRFIRLPNLLVEFQIARGNGTIRKLMVQYKEYSLLIINEWLLYTP